LLLISAAKIFGDVNNDCRPFSDRRLGCAAAMSARAEFTCDIGEGDVIVQGDLLTCDGVSQSPASRVAITGASISYQISITDSTDLEIILRNVSIPSPQPFIVSGSRVGIAFEGSNTINAVDWPSAGISCRMSSSLVFTGDSDALLDVTGLSFAAAIGTNDSETCDSLRFLGGKIIARGGDLGAGIGCGRNGTIGSIWIEGGEITASGGSSGAGIGSGSDGNVGLLWIGGGNIEASSGDSGAGIGCGVSGVVTIAEIEGGNIVASGSGGAGIGSGKSGTIESILIVGGNVTASSSHSGARIGSASGGSVDLVLIGGGNVTAVGSLGWSGIGSGDGGNVSEIVIEGGVVSATGDPDGAAIGNADSSPSGNCAVTFRGGCVSLSVSPGIRATSLTFDNVTVAATTTATRLFGTQPAFGDEVNLSICYTTSAAMATENVASTFCSVEIGSLAFSVNGLWNLEFLSEAGIARSVSFDSSAFRRLFVSFSDGGSYRGFGICSSGSGFLSDSEGFVLDVNVAPEFAFSPVAKIVAVLRTPSPTSTRSKSPSPTATESQSQSPTETRSQSPSPTTTRSKSPSRTVSRSPSPSSSRSKSPSPTRTLTHSPTSTPIAIEANTWD
jgi:hypothetical protein